MVTIKDVARRAGVSVGTASRVASKNVTVKPALRARVESAMQEMDYKPNLAARALRTNRVEIVGLILPDITNPFFAQLAKDVEIAAATVGLSVILANSLGHPGMENERIGAILDQAPRGIIIVSSSDQSSIATRPGIPCIALDRPCCDFPLVSIDNVKSAALAADHLYSLGHRRIGYIAGPRDTLIARQRASGFIDRIAALSTATDVIDLIVREGAFDYASGESIGRELLTSNQIRPTAIAAASDQQAIGVIRVARDLGLRVPADLSVVGFDDVALANLVVPRLSTIRQPVSEMAARVIAMIVGTRDLEVADRFLATLVVRDSSGVVPDVASAELPRAGRRQAS